MTTATHPIEREAPTRAIATLASTAAQDRCAHAVSVLQRREDPTRPLDTAEQRAVSIIHHGYGAMLLAVARRTLHDADDAHDVVQEVFAELPVLLTRYRHRGLGGWLRRVAVNRALMTLRRRRLHEAVVTGSALWFEDGGAWEDAEALTRSLLMALPIEARELVVLRFFLGMSHAQIAETLGITTIASEVRLSRVLALLRRRSSPPG